MRPLSCVRPIIRTMSTVVTIALVTAFCLCLSTAAFADPQPCSGTLLPGGSTTTDLLVNGPCTVVGTSGAIGVYVFRNVNIVGPSGSLTFEDTRIDFHAESIIVESGGTLSAGTVMHPIGMNPPIMGEVGARVRIYLWGPSTDDGAICAMDSMCGVDSKLWTSNPTLMNHSVPMPKNMACVKASSINPQFKLPGDDCFYGYDSFDAADKGKPAYFGHKVLALSYGGTIRLLGMKGATYDPMIDGDPSNSGTSWVRLAGISTDQTTLTLSVPVPTWTAGDHIVVTTTDYMPTHNEERVIDHLVGNTMVVLTTPLASPHNASAYPLPRDTPPSIGPRGSRTIDTRAAVGLLTRSIEILSEGKQPDTDTSEHDHFPPTKGNYYGGHTIVRQGFANYQVKGVEFYHLGQGGVIGHYPVHFHMARKTPQPSDPTQMPYVRDSSIHDSMTRWITVHATQGMTIARNVGYLSIGHGYYLEDATEVNNKLYTNLGAGVIAAVQSATLNPRNTPGILARPGDSPRGDFMPYRSDWNHPSAFWIMNGWNDFQYNMAAGVTSCGSCYWLLPGANGGPSMFETWDGYASQQLNVQDMSSLRMDNTARSGLTPLKSFIGNSCVGAMLSFTSIGDTYDCGGFSDGAADDVTLQAVTNTLAPPVTQSDTAAYHLYYPQITGLRNPSQCPGADDPTNPTDCSSANTKVPPCANTGPNKSFCVATVLDHYTTSFNYAQTNVAAIWMRPKWFLFTDGAVTDTQYGGLNFTTGGGYTHSDNPLGNWMLAYKSAFIGTSQTVGSDGFPVNGYASEAGPFNPKTGLTCSNQADRGYCLSTADAISIQVNPFPGERLFSVYDGPAFQQSNAYLDVYPTLMPGGSPGKWMYRAFFVDGVPKGANSICYLPNAAIAWKQPNGFYYPPAFHSLNLMFRNANIRHFLIEPLFVPNTWPYMPYDDGIHARYCPGNDSPGMFNNFTDIDRQTVLNDGVPDTKNVMGMNVPGGDGSLTGLIASEKQPTMTTGRETISVNEDPFFNAPLEKVECASDKHDSIADGKGAPGTAKVSPYEYVTTGMIAGCAIGFYPGTRACPPPNQDMQCSYPYECIQGDPVTGPAYWTHQGATPQTFGVPLYREYLTNDELMKAPLPKPRVLMLGQDSGQRSTLTLNHGHYYVDTSNNCDAQGMCLASNPASAHGVSVFQGGQTYYVYFIYGKASTQLTFDIYLGPNDETGKWKVVPVRGIFDTDTYMFNPIPGGEPWIDPEYHKDQNALTVTVDLSKSNIATEFTNEFSDACQPKTYCGVKVAKDGTKTCGCTIALGSSCKDDEVCSWGPKDPDCPEAGCYGFAFTMPSDWTAPPQPVDPPAAGKFSDDTYFASGNVQFQTVDLSKFGQKTQCQYTTPPTQ